MKSSNERVITYIDGFNFYHGLLREKWIALKWLDYYKLSESLLKPNQKLVAVRYFTARKSNTLHDPNLEKRQNDYLDALVSNPNVFIYEGNFQPTVRFCKHCHKALHTHTEKRSDVNLATELLVDAFNDKFDVAILMAADSDYIAPVRVINEQFPNKLLKVAIPPGNNSNALTGMAKVIFKISKGFVERAQFPDKVKLANGHVVMRPDQWR